MKKVLFCLLIGFVTVSCQNGAEIKESEIRDNFDGYCKLTGGTYDNTIDPTVCICGNYRCYHRACNYEGDACDDRICYAGDQSCNKTDIKICRSERINDTPYHTPHDFTDDYSCKTVSCTQANDEWHYKCGECLNNDIRCVQSSDDPTGQLEVCRDGNWFKIKQCDGGCKYEDGQTESKECESCTGDYCLNDNNDVGYMYICNSESAPTECKKEGTNKNVSCNYDNEEPECGLCLNEKPNCTLIELPSSSILNEEKIKDLYITKEKCQNGTWIPIGEKDPTQIQLFSDENCTAPINNNSLCLKASDTNAYPIYYHCNNSTCKVEICQYKCSPEKGCLAKDDPEEDVCAGDKNCVYSPIEDPDPPIEDPLPAPQPPQPCEPIENDYCPKSTTENANSIKCYDNNRCAKCDENKSCQECNNKLCGTIEAVYCNKPNSPDGYPYIVWKGTPEAGTPELHIDDAFLELLQNDNEDLKSWIENLFKDDCVFEIDTIVLHGGTDEFFKINCNDTFKSIQLPTNIKTIRGADSKEDGKYPIIQCKQEDKTLNVPLFESLQGVTLENFGMHINFDFSNSNETTGGFAKKITDSALINIGIAGKISCSQADSCGLLASELAYTGNYKGPEITLSGLISNYKGEDVPVEYSDIKAITVSTNKDNAGGLIGKLTLNSAKDIKIRFNKFAIQSVTGKVDNPTGSNNIGGIIGMIDSKTNTGTLSIDFSDIKIGDDGQSDHTIVIAGTSNVGGFIGSIGCENKDICDTSEHNITITGSQNTLTGTINGMYNVGGVIGSATGLSELNRFTLNGLKTNPTTGKVIGGQIGMFEDIKIDKTKYSLAYNAQNIGGLIGKLVINNNETKIENIKFKLNEIACSEYEDRLNYECKGENPTCPTDGFCMIPTQCSYGGGLIGTIKIAKRSNNKVLSFTNIHSIINTLAISKYNAGITNTNVSDKDNEPDHKYGSIKISDSLFTIGKVDSRFDLYGIFRGLLVNIRFFKSIELRNNIAVIKLNDIDNQNYCIFNGEYNGTTSPDHQCFISSARFSNSKCVPEETKDSIKCSDCVSKYISNYPNFLIYGPDCIYDCNNTCKNMCNIDSTFFYQFNNYSTNHRTYKQGDNKSFMKSTSNKNYGSCFYKDNSETMCTYMQRDCGTSVNLFCCDSYSNEVCSNQISDICKFDNNISKIGNDAKSNCDSLEDLKKKHTENPTFFENWDFENMDTFSNDNSVQFPTPPFCLAPTPPNDSSCKEGTSP